MSDVTLYACVFFNHMLVREWSEARLELNARLPQSKNRIGRAADMANADHGIVGTLPSHMQARPCVFGCRVIPLWQRVELHPLLHIDDDQGWGLGMVGAVNINIRRDPLCVTPNVR